jgi:uncharacterized damage-inducible protein DinB
MGEVARRTRAEHDRGTLLHALAEGYHGPAWHGASLRGALAGVRAAEATWRPAEGRPSIGELALHAAYGKHRVLGRLDRALASRFPRRLRRAWWPELPAELDERAWRADLGLLEECHRRLADAVATADPARLRARRAGSARTIGEELLGIAMHDVYHAGQVRLLRKLYAARGR